MEWVRHATIRLPAHGDDRRAVAARWALAIALFVLSLAVLVSLSWLLRGAGLWGDLAFAIVVTTGVFWILRRLASRFLGESNEAGVPARLRDHDLRPRRRPGRVGHALGWPRAALPAGARLGRGQFVYWLREASRSQAQRSRVLAGGGRRRRAPRDRALLRAVGGIGRSRAAGGAGGDTEAGRRADEAVAERFRPLLFLRLERACASRSTSRTRSRIRMQMCRKAVGDDNCSGPRGGRADRREPGLPRDRGGTGDRRAAATTRARSTTTSSREDEPRLRRLLVVLLPEPVAGRRQGLLRPRPAHAALHVPGARRRLGGADGRARPCTRGARMRGRRGRSLAPRRSATASTSMSSPTTGTSAQPLLGGAAAPRRTGWPRRGETLVPPRDRAPARTPSPSSPGTATPRTRAPASAAASSRRATFPRPPTTARALGAQRGVRRVRQAASAHGRGRARALERLPRAAGARRTASSPGAYCDLSGRPEGPSFQRRYKEPEATTRARSACATGGRPGSSSRAEEASAAGSPQVCQRSISTKTVIPR